MMYMMGNIHQVPVQNKSLRYLEEVLGKTRALDLRNTLYSLHDLLGSGTLWHINSTAKGGGVAEMLPHMLGYKRDFGVNTSWLTISGTDPFFAVTKRLHHALHGSRGDGSALGDAERAIYESVVKDNASELLEIVGKDDIVILHDPQTAGLIQHLKGRVRAIIWRCHIGHDQQNESVTLGWNFLAPYLKQADRYIFSRTEYIPSVVNPDDCFIIAPSIDPLSPKNEPMEDDIVHQILVRIGVLQNGVTDELPTFVRHDGSTGKIERKADIVRVGKAVDPSAPLIVQISRWDPLKDHPGVLRGFEELINSGYETNAELLLVGPDVKSVSDDPEGLSVYESVCDAWRALPDAIKDRVHLATLPMDDVEENAAMVNAIQRHASIIIQKSLHEGFGLTVTEAMWKGRALIASAVGGIQDQIEHGKSGLLLSDPTNVESLRDALQLLLSNQELRQSLGKRAHERVSEHFLVTRHMHQYLELVRSLLH